MTKKKELEHAAPVFISSLNDLKNWAINQLLPDLSSREVVLLEGEMGVGKTQLVRFILEGMGSKEVASPTFSIHHCYSTLKGDVHHVDLYRLQDEEDLESTGFWDLFSIEKGLILIEWANRLERDFLSRHWPCRQIALEFSSSSPSNERKISHKILWR